MQATKYDGTKREQTVSLVVLIAIIDVLFKVYFFF